MLKKQKIIATFLGIITLIATTPGSVFANSEETNSDDISKILTLDTEIEKSYPISGINKIIREKNSLSLFTSENKLKTTGTLDGKSYETIVENGKVTKTKYGSNSKIPTNSSIENNSFVISGRGISDNEAGDWLLKNAKPGNEVQLDTSEPNNMKIKIINTGNPPEAPKIENPNTETPGETPGAEIPTEPEYNDNNKPNPNQPPLPKNPEDTNIQNPEIDQIDETAPPTSIETPLQISPGEKVEIPLNLDRRGETVSIRIISQTTSFQMFSTVNSENTVKFLLPPHINSGFNSIKIKDEKEIVVGWADIFVIMQENEKSETKEENETKTAPTSGFETIELEYNSDTALANTGINNKIIFFSSATLVVLGVFLLIRKYKATKLVA